jgi:choline/glycine/proline betaine transport protein
MLLMCWGLFRALRLDVMKRASIRDAHPLPQGAAAGEWKTRLQMLVRQPGKREVLQFLREQVHPALEAVAGELQAQGVQARVESDDEGGGRVWLRVGHGEEMDFFYSAHLEAYDPPSFVMEDPRRRRREEARSYRAAVHLREGGQGYDLMGWRREEIIHDVLDQYQRHMHFLDVVR